MCMCMHERVSCGCVDRYRRHCRRPFAHGPCNPPACSRGRARLTVQCTAARPRPAPADRRSLPPVRCGPRWLSLRARAARARAQHRQVCARGAECILQGSHAKVFHLLIMAVSCAAVPCLRPQSRKLVALSVTLLPSPTARDVRPLPSSLPSPPAPSCSGSADGGAPRYGSPGREGAAKAAAFLARVDPRGVGRFTFSQAVAALATDIVAM